MLLLRLSKFCHILPERKCGRGEILALGHGLLEELMRSGSGGSDKKIARRRDVYLQILWPSIEKYGRCRTVILLVLLLLLLLLLLLIMTGELVPS